MANTWVEMGEGNMSTLNKAVYAHLKDLLVQKPTVQAFICGRALNYRPLGLPKTYYSTFSITPTPLVTFVGFAIP